MGIREPRHGIHAVRTEFGGAEFVTHVHDDTEGGLDAATMRRVAEEALGRPIFWNDLECRHWMFDFQVCGHWCEMLRYMDPFEIRVYE